MWTGQFFSKIDDNMQMRFLTSLSSNIPKTGYLFKFKEKNRFWGHPQGGRVGYTQISEKFLKAYSQTYSQKLPELLSIASVLLAKRRMLTCHEGKGWGFQAGVLKGDFAQFQTSHGTSARKWGFFRGRLLLLYSPHWNHLEVISISKVDVE